MDLTAWFYQSLIGFIYAALFLFTITAIKYYPKKFFPRLAHKFHMLLKPSQIIVILLFYGGWAVLGAAFAQPEIAVSKSVAFILYSVNFIFYLLFLEFIRLKKDDVLDYAVVAKPQYLVYSMVIFQIFILHPELLDQLYFWKSFEKLKNYFSKSL